MNLESDDPHYVIARTYNFSAWSLAKSDPAKAVALAQKAVALSPQSARYWFTLGVSQYRAADWRAAVATLDKSKELAPLKDLDKASDFFLSIALWQLGEREQARDCYDRATTWLGQHAPHDQRFKSFQREAAELLGLPVPSESRLLLPGALPLGSD
jgi:tetratricopeptide (TPR) repeat protein